MQYATISCTSNAFDKPSKNETVTFLRLSNTISICADCDKKRISACKDPNCNRTIAKKH